MAKRDLPRWPADKVERRPVDSLIPYARNARTHSDAQVAQIAAAIREWGWTNPILVAEDGTIIAGHGRVLAAMKLGLADVPVMVAAGWTDAQRRAYILADNKLTLNGGWDADMLALELGDLNSDGFDLALTGFGDKELLGLLGSEVEKVELHGDPEDVPEAPSAPVSRAGDVWVLGRHRLVCGDATSKDDWDRLEIPRPSIAFTSPPYGVGGSARIRDHYVPGKKALSSLYASHADDPGEWPDLMRGWTNLAIAFTDCVVCNVQTLANNKRSLIAWQAEYAEHLVDIAVWDKGQGAPQMHPNVLTNAFEWIFLLSPERGASRSIVLADFHGTESNVVRIAKGVREYSDIHRATMPVELAEWAIRVVGAKATSVVDPFSGTGTTLIAAEMHRKDARLIEIDPTYCDVIVRRWQDFTGKTATLEGDGRTFDEISVARRKA